ncbi:MmgE/PrpD family protein [Pseudonocardia acaciae]|uniref:MmgE/PrpD family protein n=1 Tax=Pseudonocardia acaciae TaxID=551276 RepID=UPI0006857F80|nr:MmgE/PrpD family protein [Pseudonocardia acaciae]
MTVTHTRTTSQLVAEFVAGFEFADAPPDVREKAKVTLLHDLGVGLAGHRLAETAFALAKDVGAAPNGGGARLPVDGTSVTVDMAALATGAMVHARTQDDTQLAISTHLGATTLPALLALGDRSDSSGTELLTAMVAGYEAASAIAEAHAADSTARGFRASSIYGPLASAAACARLLGLNQEQTTSALGLAAGFGGGTNQTWVAGTQEWRYQVGMASRNGMTAALLAARGVTGAPDALEGAAGHYRSFAGTQPAEPAGADLGERWRTRDVTYKPFPVCAINQVPVTVMVDLVTTHDVHPEQVADVELRLAPVDAAYPGTDTHGPFTDVGGTLMSAPYCLAVAIRRRTVVLDDLYGFDDTELMGLADRIQVIPDETLTTGSCRITVRLRDGASVSDSFLPGPDTFNWGRDEAADRLRQIAGEMPLSPAGLDEFIAVVLDLDNRTVRELIDKTLP